VAVKKYSISTLMKLTGILALNLAVLRVMPVEFLGVALFVYLVAALDLALALLLVYRRPLGVRHTVFLLLGFLLIIAHAVYVDYQLRVNPAFDPTWPRILKAAVQTYASFIGEPRPQKWMRPREFEIADGFLVSSVGLALCWSLGLGFEWLLRVRRVNFNGRRWRGTVGAAEGATFGLFLAVVLMIGLEAGFSSMRKPSPAATLIRLAVTLSLLLIGGVLGWILGRRIRDDAPRS
jgi:hypothetical protein